MKNKKNEINNVLLGLVIGGIVGGATYYLWKGSQERSRPLLDKLGRAISDVGEILEGGAVHDRYEALEELQQAIPKGDTANHILTWLATGVNLWKKMKRD